MADNLVIYKVQDQQSGKVLQIEGPEGATEDELNEFLLSQEAPAPTPTAPQAVTPAAQPSGPSVVPTAQAPVQPQAPAQVTNNTVSTIEQGGDSAANPNWMSPEQEAEYLRLSADEKVSYDDLNAWTKQQFEAARPGAYYMPIGGSVEAGREQTAKYRESIAKSGKASNQVEYREWTDQLAPVAPTAKADSAIVRAYQDAVQYGTPGWLARTYADWTDQGIEDLRKRFPDATDEQLEIMQEQVIAHVQKKTREANIAATADDPLIPWLAGQVIGSAGIEDFIPGGEAITGLNRAAKRTGIAAATNTGADVAYQGADIYDGVQDEYNLEQTLAAPVLGAAFQGGIEGLSAIASTVKGRISRAPDAVDIFNPGDPIVAPTGRKNSKAYKAGLSTAADGVVAHVDKLTENWKNKPEFEVYESFDKLPDADNDALGFLAPDGKVRLNVTNILAEAKARKIDAEDVVSALTYHEALGHYGLSQKFGDDLDNILDGFYNNANTSFKAKVDEWLVKNPDEYVNAPNRTVRAAEEVLAEMSERGRIPVTMVNKITNKIKEYARKAGLDLKVSEREVKTILGMAHSAVVNGKGRDVTSNGYKFKKGGPGYGEALLEYSRAASIRPSELYDQLQKGTNPDAEAFIASRAAAETGENVPLPSQYFQELRRDNGGNIFLEYRNSPSDTPIPIKMGVDDGVAEIAVDQFSTLANRLGPAKVREAMYELMRIYPEIRTFGGFRRSGAGKGRVQELTPKAINKYSKKLSRESDDDSALRAEYIVRELLDGYTPTVRSLNDARAAAKEAGMSPSQIKKFKSPQELDKRIFALDNAADRLNTKVLRLMEAAEEAETPALYKQQILDAILEFQQVNNHLLDQQAEVGRALRAMREVTYTKRKLTELNELLADFEGSNISAFANDDIFNRFAKQVQELMSVGNTKGATKLMATVMEPYWWQYILSARHSMMLSGLGTHVKNAYDNAAMVAREMEEIATALPGFYVRKGLQKAGYAVEDGVSPQEVAARGYGLMRALLDSETYANTWKTFKEGHGNRQYSSKIEMQDARIPGLSKIQDFLHASDTFFRAFHDNANLYTLGVREARKQGFRGIEAFEEGSAIAQAPSLEMRKEARTMSDVALLVDTPSYIAAKLEGAKAIAPNMSGGAQAGAFAVNFMLPFFRVTDRLLFQKIRRLGPVALLDRVTREELAAGGAKRDVALGRMALSSALIWYYWENTGDGEGELTGNSVKDRDKLAALQAGGYMPNSVKEDGKYVDASALNLSILPTDLQNALATNIATIRETYENGLSDTESTAKAMALATRSLLTELVSVSFAENLTTYLEPFVGEEYEQDAALANVAGGAASQFVPAAARQFNAMVTDPYKRDTTGDKTLGDRVAGRVMSGIPGLSDNLPLKYDLYGDPVEQGRSLSATNNYQTIKNDPVSKELQRLERTVPEAVVRGAPSSFTHEGEKIKLNAEGKQEWQRVQGYYLVDMMKEEIQSPEWKAASDADKILIVKDVRKDAYDLTKEYMLPLLGVSPSEEEEEEE